VFASEARGWASVASRSRPDEVDDVRARPSTVGVTERNQNGSGFRWGPASTPDHYESRERGKGWIKGEERRSSQTSSLKVPSDTLSETVVMSPSATRLLEISDRRDQMVLTMAVDAALVKTKSRESRHKKERQVAYRRVRYQRFKGRRGDAMEGEVREVVRARRAKSLQRMVMWLELQERANAEEGGPRMEEDEDGLDDVPLVFFVAQPLATELRVIVPVEVGRAAAPCNQRLIRSFFGIRG